MEEETFDRFPDVATICYIERLATAKAFLERETHSHSFQHEGKYINAYPEVKVIVVPIKGKKDKYHIEATCPVCNERLHKTTKAIEDTVEQFHKIRFGEPKKLQNEKQGKNIVKIPTDHNKKT